MAIGPISGVYKTRWMDTYRYETYGFQWRGTSRRWVRIDSPFQPILFPILFWNERLPYWIWPSRPPIPCHHVRVLIIANHLNGKDTHLRGLKIFGTSGYVCQAVIRDYSKSDCTEYWWTDRQPTQPTLAVEARSPERGMSGKQLLELGHDGLSGFTSQQFKMHEWIRWFHDWTE